jgi:hypothetical protein
LELPKVHHVARLIINEDRAKNYFYEVWTEATLGLINFEKMRQYCQQPEVREKANYDEKLDHSLMVVLNCFSS